MGGRCRRVLLGLGLGLVLQTSAFVPLHVTKTAEGGRSLLPVSRRHRATRLHYKAGDSYELYKELPKEAVDEIEEGAARDMLERLQSWEVAVPEEVAEGGKVRVTGVGPRERRARFDLPAVVLLHGFDSSCLEYRRLHPLLDEEVDVFALDVLGWGFSQLEGVKSFSAEAKRAYLYGFWTDVLQRRPMVLVGASLGGAIAIDFSHAHPQAVDKLVFLNPQAFIDGLGGMSSLPRPLANLGISVLKSVPLRRYAGQLSYYDPKTWSTEDAMRIGRLHCLRDQWSEAAVDYMLSGGYKTIDKVSSLQKKSVLVLWGRQDKILEPSVVERLGKELPQARITYVENCGHVAHLEKPRAAANAMLDFVIRPAATPPTLPWAQGRDVSKVSCRDCLDEEVVPCPNCEGQGWYESFGRRVDCKACRTTGLVICRSCYKGAPEDVPGIREIVRQAAARLGRPAPKVMP